MDGFIEALIPMFVACDPLGLVPQFWALTERKDEKSRRMIALESCAVALLLGFIFAVAGIQVFNALGITVDDFRIGGGIVFLIIAIRIVLGVSEKSEGALPDDNSISVVPIATPSIVGPAVIANIVMLTQQRGLAVSMGVFTTITLMTLGILFFSTAVRRIVGEKVVKAVSRIFAIMMVGIAVMFIRLGLQGMLMGR